MYYAVIALNIFSFSQGLFGASIGINFVVTAEQRPNRMNMAPCSVTLFISFKFSWFFLYIFFYSLMFTVMWESFCLSYMLFPLVNKSARKKKCFLHISHDSRTIPNLNMGGKKKTTHKQKGEHPRGKVEGNKLNELLVFCYCCFFKETSVTLMHILC